MALNVRPREGICSDWTSAYLSALLTASCSLVTAARRFNRCIKRYKRGIY